MSASTGLRSKWMISELRCYLLSHLSILSEKQLMKIWVIIPTIIWLLWNWIKQEAYPIPAQQALVWSTSLDLRLLLMMLTLYHRSSHGITKSAIPRTESQCSCNFRKSWSNLKLKWMTLTLTNRGSQCFSHIIRLKEFLKTRAKLVMRICQRFKPSWLTTNLQILMSKSSCSDFFKSLRIWRIYKTISGI